jgi:hypothetical protein
MNFFEKARAEASLRTHNYFHDSDEWNRKHG